MKRGLSDAALRPLLFLFLEPEFTTADCDDLRSSQNLIMHCSGFFSSGDERRKATRRKPVMLDVECVDHCGKER